MNLYCVDIVHFLHFRHVKGRVLVALADGTVAIFHRDTGLVSLCVLFLFTLCVVMYLDLCIDVFLL